MSNWGGRGKVHAVNDDVEVFDIDDVHHDDNSSKVIEIKSLKSKNSFRIDDDAEIGNISRLGITGITLNIHIMIKIILMIIIQDAGRDFLIVSSSKLLILFQRK